MKNITFCIITVLVFLPTCSLYSQNIVINEILASNTSSIQDEDGTYQDWIELFNGGTADVNLQGYGLSDDSLLPFKWTFPNVTLNKGGYLIIWASDKNRAVAGSPLHTNFKISSSGENISLTKSSGTIVDQIPPVKLSPDVSYGRFPNGSNSFVFFGTPTPNAANTTTAYSGILSPPTFSQNSGFFTTGFNLTITAPDPGTTIFYTLDGSEPDETNLNGTTYTYKNQYTELPGQTTGPFLKNSYRTLQYTSPLNITDRTNEPNKVSVTSSTFDYDPTRYFPNYQVYKGTIIKAKAVKTGFLSSETVTKNYFIDPLGYKKYTLPVVSLSINEDRFFDYNSGIYVAGIDYDNWRAANPNAVAKTGTANYDRRTDNERVGNINYFVNGVEVINQNVGLRIRGGSTRRYECKSLTVYARDEYGDDELGYKFFSDLPYTNYERLTLSNSGNDFRNTMFRDALNQQLCKTLHVETEAYQPTICFLNGEFWGIINLRPRYDNNYFAMVYNTQSVDFLEDNAAVEEGDADNYNAMTNYVQTHSLADPTNFAYIKTQLDPESFSDFFISNIFFGNSDFPNNNVQYWRNKIDSYNPNAPYGLDGRWRWLLHDMDDTFAFGTDDYNTNTLAIATSVNTSNLNPDWATLLLRKLLENDSFKNDFINRFADLLNTYFLPTRINSTIDTMKAGIYSEIPGQILRWQSPATMDDYDYDITYEQNFALQRPDIQRNQIRSVFSIASNLNATLNVSDPDQGYIKMNTIDIIDGTPGISGNPYPWTGIYFQNIPVTLKAIAKPGFAFDHWTGASTSTQDEITLTPTADFSITAVFVASTVEVSVPIYFWMMDSNITNDAQLTSLNSTYQLNANAVIQYQSCITGYPFSSSDPNYSKASMERRNLPTDINYRSQANNNIAYTADIMKGLQIKEPLQKDGLENMMIFNVPTSGYKEIQFSSAVVNELTNASAILIDYSVNSGAPVWTTIGLTTTSLPMTASYQLLQTDFSAITTVENNPYFKIRLRFTGSNMTMDNGNRITFNNIAVDGVKIPLSYPSPNVFTVGAAITNMTPFVTQTISSYSVSPSLPTGLVLNTATGVISGTPTTVTPAISYAVTANYTGGSFTFNLMITIVNNLAVDDPTLNKLKIYPNPVTDVLNVTGIDSYFSYEIFTVDGKLIQTENHLNNSINLSELPIGIYILQLSYDDITTIKKIIKNNSDN